MPYTDHLTAEDVEQLLEETTGPCVSLYLPTTPVTSGTDKDRIQLKNLHTAAFDELLKREVRRPDAEDILLPVDELLDDESFWPYLSDGLAIFCSAKTHATFRLPISPQPSWRVSERFILKPLIPLFNEDGIFYIMALSRNEIRFFEGTRYHVAELPTGDIPKSMSDALKIRKRPSMSAPGKILGDEGQKEIVFAILYAN